ncbi:hypothetical protein EAG_04913 [Camponotus floridanus]|uniref:Uncharacterized protein n=1 Tax=Camponotus floridanus TaxID=104421 RepID=E2ARA3_CAMFO|nr:hypothetical protein EAG_04913 [Camponotus floridanus]
MRSVTLHSKKLFYAYLRSTHRCHTDSIAFHSRILVRDAEEAVTRKGNKSCNYGNSALREAVHSETRSGAGVTNAKLDNVTYERTIWLETSRVSSTDTNSRRFTTQPGGMVDATLGERVANESKKQTRSVVCVIEAINVLRFRCCIVRAATNRGFIGL